MIVGMRPLKARLRSLTELEDVMKQVQIETVKGAKLRVPVKTGFLRRSIVPGNVSDDFAIIEVNAPYAAAVEFGTRPHVIVPRNARVLAWPSSEGSRRLSGRARKGTQSGDMAFARKVNHPGTKPQPYAVPAAIEAIHTRLIPFIIRNWNRAG